MSHSRAAPPPVKQRAITAGIAVLQPERPKGAPFLDSMRALMPDLGVVVAYGDLLSSELLDLPRLGMVNVHASLLPRWRGAAPIHHALLAGDAETGVSIMRVEAGLDSGAVWHSASTPIGDADTTGTLFERLSHLGAIALVAALPGIAAGELPMAQTSDGVTHAPKIDRASARVRWERPAPEVSRQIRAMDPAPGAWSTVNGSQLKFFAPTPGASRTEGIPGAFHMTPDGELEIAALGGWVRVADVQPAGRSRMSAAAWLRGSTTRSGRFE